MSIEPTNKSRWHERLYDAIFNSKGTAIVSLVVLAGAAVRGIMVSIEGKPELVIALSTIVVILFVTKIVDQIKKS